MFIVDVLNSKKNWDVKETQEMIKEIINSRFDKILPYTTFPQINDPNGLYAYINHPGKNNISLRNDPFKGYCNDDFQIWAETDEKNILIITYPKSVFLQYIQTVITHSLAKKTESSIIYDYYGNHDEIETNPDEYVSIETYCKTKHHEPKMLKSSIRQKFNIPEGFDDI